MSPGDNLYVLFGGFDGDMSAYILPQYAGEGSAISKGVSQTTFDAWWGWTAEDYDPTRDENDPREPVEQLAGVENVVLFRDTVLLEVYEDLMQRFRDDGYYDEEGEPYFTAWGFWYNLESFEFDRKEFVQFVLELLNGKLKRVDTGANQFVWKRLPGSLPAKIRRPSSPEEWARWVRALGLSAMQNFGGGGQQIAATDIAPRGLLKILGLP